MKTVKWVLETGYRGCEHEGEIQVDDDATEDDIEELVKEEAYGYVDLMWKVE